MTQTDCRYLVAPDSYQTGVSLSRLRLDEAPKMLCIWAHYHPDAVEKLSNTPPWLATVALASDQWRPGQCKGCPCYEAGAALETPRAA